MIVGDAALARRVESVRARVGAATGHRNKSLPPAVVLL
jgi:hypothetical protein